MDIEALKEQWSEVEDRDGLRLSWNVFPSSRMSGRCSRTIVDLPVLSLKKPLPPHYKDITANAIPPELHPSNTTIEYRLSRPAPSPPIFLYVVDTCQEEDSLSALKESLVMSLSLLPENALVGLVTFGTMAQVHEIGYTECPKSYVFRGSKDYSAKQVQEMLGLLAPGLRPGMQQQQPGRPLAPMGPAARFLLPVQQCEFQLTKALEQLQKDPWPVASDRRNLRCTGVALSVAVGLLESSFQNAGGRIMLFAGGPATEGPGLVVGPELREPIRSHHDIDRDNIKYYKKALKFYDNLAKRTAHNGHIIDIFAGCLDQVGLLEMKGLSNSTGGHMVLTDSFTSSMFKQSFVRIFEKDGDDNLLMGFNASLEVLTTKELKVTGLIGHAVSMNKKSTSVGETECGIGNTCSWKMCGIDPSASYGIYFEIASQGGPTQHQQTPQKGMMQFLTYYQHSSGQFHLRVTTVSRNLSGPAGDPAIAQSFDQEAAAVLMSRIAVFKAEVDDGPDVLRWVDRMLIRLCSRFADYRKDDPSSFRLEKNFTLYPQFMFHLRRSQFLQVFNNSPDETAFYRHVLNHEDVSNSLIMIQPTLDSYTFDQDGSQPVLLDSTSIQPTHILLLDTFFHILIFHGETVAEWRKAGYQDQEGYENFGALLELPKEDARDLITDRFPLPRFIVCDAGGSQARFLLSKLNPSTTHTTGAYGGVGAQTAQTIFTDDVSLQTFMDHLMKLANSRPERPCVYLGSPASASSTKCGSGFSVARSRAKRISAHRIIFDAKSEIVVKSGKQHHYREHLRQPQTCVSSVGRINNALADGTLFHIAPKVDPNEIKVIHLRATGGEVGASSALAPKIGPLGLSPKKVGEDIAKATGDWKGLRVTVKLTIQNRQAAVSVVPSASSLVIKALKEPPRDRKKEKNIKHSKSVPLDEIIEIARTMRFKSLSKELKGTVKEILGTAFSVGCQVDGRSPKDVSDDIESGEIETYIPVLHSHSQPSCYKQMNMIPQIAHHPRHVSQQFGSPGFAVPPFEPLPSPSSRRLDPPANLPFRSLRDLNSTSLSTPPLRAYPLENHAPRRTGLARGSSSEQGYPSQYNDPSEHMLRRKTPNGTLAAGYDGTPVQWSSKAPALKHVVLPLTGSAARSSTYPPAGANEQPLRQRPGASSWGYQQPGQYGGSSSANGDLRPIGEVEQWSHLPSMPDPSHNMWDHIGMQQGATYYPNNGTQIPTVLQPSYLPSPGPTASNDGGLYGPYWPDGKFVPYRPAAFRGHHYPNQDSYLNGRISGNSKMPGDLLPPFRPPSMNLETDRNSHMGNPLFSFPEQKLHAPDHRFEAPTQIHPLHVDTSLYASNPEGSRTPIAESANRASNLRFREKTLAWAHSIYVDLLAFLQQSKREHRSTNQAHGSKSYSKTSIYPKPPRQPTSYLSTPQWTGLNAGISEASSSRRHVGNMMAPSYRPAASRDQGRWQGGGLGEARQSSSSSHEARHYVSPFQTGQYQSGSPLSKAKEALELLTNLCEQSGWYWVDGMLLGGCLAYGLEQYHDALDWYSKIIALDSKHVEAISNLAATLLCLNRREEAEQHWLQSVKLLPSYFEAVEHLIGLLCGDHRGNEAVGIIDFVERSLRLPKSEESQDYSSETSSNADRESCASAGTSEIITLDYDRDSESIFHIPPTKDYEDTSGEPGFGSSGFSVPGCENGRILALVHAKGNMLYALGDINGASKAFEDAVLISAGRGLHGIQGLIQKIVNVLSFDGLNGLPLDFRTPLAEPPTPLLLPPDKALQTARLVFSKDGELPGLRHVPEGLARKAAISTTSNSLLSLAKIFQDAMSNSTSPQRIARIPAGVGDILALYYLSLSLQPSPSTANNVGILLASVQQPAAQRAITHRDSAALPAIPGVVPGSGVALALAYYNYGLNLDPRHAHIYTNLGSLLKDIGQLTAAITMYEKAVACDSSFDIALANLANAVKDQGRTSDAIEYYRRAVASSPDFAEAVCGLANALNSVCDWAGRGGVILDEGRQDRWHVDETGMICEARSNGSGGGWMKRVVDIVNKQLKEGSTWGRGSLQDQILHQFIQQLEAADAGGAMATGQESQHTGCSFQMAKDIRMISQRNALRISCSTLRAPWLPASVFSPPSPPSPHLNIGYVSSDFNNHPLAHLMQSVFGLHNPSRAKAFCYATTASDNSVHRQQIEREAPVFHDASSWPADRLIQQIIHDGIHILINLNGYTRGARNEVFAARPAPIQMSFMGFAGTLGAEWCDYLLADETAIPPDTLRPWRRNLELEDQLLDHQSHEEDHWVYSENIIFCRDTFFCCDHAQSEPRERRLTWDEEQSRRWQMRKELFPSLSDDAIILGNFNQLYKIEPTTFRTWLRILDKVPKAILWLLRFPDLGESNLKRTAQEWAGDSVASRIWFTDVAPKHQHISRARVCDLFLDTPECNAHTTAADVLWSSTPLLTLPRYKYKMCSRMAASILKGALPRSEEGRKAAEELIAKDDEQYEEFAIKLAGSFSYRIQPSGRGEGVGRLGELRRLLFDSRWTCALFDTKRWVSDLESAYDEAWRKWVANEGGDIYL
ncbi:hypothetical protein G7Y89_g8449 [Cudoniella acicularis]|uniref:protein O-GlcNAc transferase n=1 Tax=Cudoniella acicularis TaxID=354080 RepID=A0A8H4W121_9HELO|nr:hypothetical protein G7Y89_g8449 [Cudoniella acicularis]